MKIAVDASALLAVLLDEPDAEVHLSKLLAASAISISAVNWWEVQVRMLERYGDDGEARSAALLESVGVRVESVTAEQSRIAVRAFARYRGRSARLNMGDCFAYALARAKGVPLLYKGNDFARTDVSSA